MSSKEIIRMKIVLKQNIIPFLIVILWFLCNYIYFIIFTSNFIEALLILFYFKKVETLYGNFYNDFSDFIIFGTVFSFITLELFRKYRPVETCEELAKRYSDHAIIIGYSHLGKRLANYFNEHRINYVLIESNYELVEDLIKKEVPLINDSPLSVETLEAASVRNAKAVYITTDDLEVQFVASAHVREMNKSCKLVGRIFEDDIADVVANNYNAEIISTSKYASEEILTKIEKNNYKNMLIIGLNHISLRLIEKIKIKGYINYHIIEENEEVINKANIDKSSIIHGDPTDISLLRKIKVEEKDCVINVNPDMQKCILIIKTIREFNYNCKIISRFFLDSIADILEKSPFRSEIISTSRDTLEIMKSKGMLEF